MLKANAIAPRLLGTMLARMEASGDAATDSRQVSAAERAGPRLSFVALRDRGVDQGTEGYEQISRRRS
jgi:hypothetical protein